MAELLFAGFVQKGRVAGRLPEPQERLQHMHLRFAQTLFLHHAQQRIAVMVAKFVVQPLLIGSHIAVDRLFELVGQFTGHLAFRSSQDERVQTRWTAVVAIVISGVGGVAFEDRTATEHARIQKFKDRPQIAQMVFDGRPAQGYAVVGLEQPDAFATWERGILDGLGFVQYHIIESHVLQMHDVPAERAIGGQDDVIFGEVRP